MNSIALAKQQLPLPALMHQLGLGEHARKSARCPFHDDQHNSWSIYKNGKGEWRFKCFAGCGEGDEITFLEKHRNVLNGVATKLFLELAGVNGSLPPSPKSASRFTPRSTPPLDWQRCVEAFTDEHIQRLADWRGLSGELCSWLKQNGLVGLYDGCIAFPICDESGNVVAAHYRPKTGEWQRYPTGFKTRPIVIGELLAGEPVHIFESQWDAFAFMDKSGGRSGIVVTLGAQNGKLVAGLIPTGPPVYAWKQNDELKNGKRAGDEWLKDVATRAGAKVLWAKTPEQFKDLNEWTKSGASVDDLLAAIKNAEVVLEGPRPLIEFKTPLQLKHFAPPPGLVLAGDCHIVRGSVVVIGGPPGVGKSRSSVALAEAGATANEWFGLSVHRRFKTMIVQTENGEFRLSREFAELDCNALEDFVRICPPPPFGLCLGREDFRAQLGGAIREFGPDVIVLDPWNAAARDEKAREYLETFELIRSLLPMGDDAPAICIVAHTRKPRADERATGRGLLNLLAGSYVLGSVPRTVFVMQAASDDTTDKRVVWTCCKNNDGELGVRSAWERRNGLFAPVPEFDWENFDDPHKDERVTIAADDLAEIFENGEKEMTRADAAKALQTLTGAGRTACYNALTPDGRFAKHLRETRGLLSWKP